jgi:[ribosomal protein S5]-alanine N-acetyltransferase
MSFPTLATERLELRQTTSADAADIFAVFSNMEVVEFYDRGPMLSASEAEETISKWYQLYEGGRGIRWGITLCNSGEVIGTCGFFNINKTYFSATLGYDLARPYWGKGLMTEALRTILQYGFDHYSLNRVQAETYLDSKRSIATLLRLGFREEGVLRQQGFWKGQFHDVRCFSLLRSDWKSMPGKSPEPTAVGAGSSDSRSTP